MIRFRDLTDSQRALICNGCGPKFGGMMVPEFFCHASCDHHDFNYWLGCSIWDRLKADLQFLREMLRDASFNPLKLLISITYFTAVRIFGPPFFHYAKKMRDETDLTTALSAMLPGGC